MHGISPYSHRNMLLSRTSTVVFIASLGLIAGCIYTLTSGIISTKEPEVQRPNIIVIIADDLGWNDVSFHGANEIPTPNIDALAYYGVILQRHYVLPTCTPSRTAFLTGSYPIRTGMQGYPLQAGEPRAIPLNNTLLPEYLQRLGYSTHLVGKWHVGYYSANHTPSNRGFDTFYGYYSGYVTYFDHTIEQNLHTGYDLHNDDSSKLSVNYNYEYLTDLITDKAENIIAKHDPRKPLYLQLSHVAVHSSDSKEVMEVRNMTEVNSTLGYIKDFNRRKFAGVMTALDESVGKVTEALRKANLLQNSIVVFMTDNGAQTEGFLQNYGSNYPLRGLKFTEFEGAVRGTACIYSPLIKKSSRISNQLMHMSDWLPTFYSAAGGNLEDLEENLDGIDQWSSIVSEKKTKRSSMLVNIDEVSGVSVALVGKYKLIKGAKLEYGGYYGDTGTDESYPEYNTSSVLQSLAGSAIASISKPKLATKDIIELRDEARVVCKNVTIYPKCLDECLFDVYSDPCETTDLSFAHPEIVEELNNYINDYNKVLMNQTNKPVDPASFPEHFNGTWMPWIILPSD